MSWSSIASNGLEADLSAIRVGGYFKRLTEFNLLQRVHRAIDTAVTGGPESDLGGSEED